ncbi:MAG: methyltransferase domain-containing protein, partial [Proteobacteria bacterium]|nr:methyltransferase domain-containing protein [Pseudomonadota bacterium]
KFDHMLDMGCGTGIAGSVFRNICHSMTGVDISTKMIQVSSQKNIYDRLIGQGIPQYLDETTEKYDLFVATDVLIYFGELGQIFSAVKNRRLREETYFIFSVEHLEEGNYKLNPSGRFSHSVQYIHNIANRIGWKILYDECVPLRMNKGQQVIGRHIIMR